MAVYRWRDAVFRPEHIQKLAAPWMNIPEGAAAGIAAGGVHWLHRHACARGGFWPRAPCDHVDFGALD